MISAKLKHLRQSAGLKQQYLAYKLGTSQTHICELESGHITPTVQVLELYSTFFNKGSVKDLINKHFE
jgi:transcriptional regulator with XRE-family HTH domain